MASFVYDNFQKEVMDGSFDLSTGADTLKCALLTSSYTPNESGHTVFGDLTNEVVGTGYTAGGVTLTSQDTSVAAGTAKFDAADAEWTTATITARYAVLYSTTATSKLIALYDFASDKSSSAGTFTVQWNAAGLLTIAE